MVLKKGSVTKEGLLLLSKGITDTVMVELDELGFNIVDGWFSVTEKQVARNGIFKAIKSTLGTATGVDCTDDVCVNCKHSELDNALQKEGCVKCTLGIVESTSHYGVSYLFGCNKFKGGI